ncbi:MAG: molecular chaperone TorD family protein [Eggerthellaceae bacterium]|nr:molecular chaperone TorD family protein [Eggerthellaceae bacterium]
MMPQDPNNIEDVSTEDEGAVSDAELIDVLEARAGFYELLSSWYFYPLSQEQLEQLAAFDFSIYSGIIDDLDSVINDITRALRKMHTGTRELIARDFTAAFAGTSAYEGKSAMPCESVFTSNTGLMMQNSYVEVSKVFRKEKIRKKEGFDWPEDHISIMFNFMAVLSRRAIGAIESGDRKEAGRNLELSRDFLENQILSWFDDFQELANKMISMRFYRGVLSFTRGYMNLDLETLSDMIEELKV